MASESDTRIKNRLLQITAEANLKNLKPRHFRESKDDQALWADSDEGLTFEVDGFIYGSNDFGWYLDSPTIIQGKKSNTTPVILVEGTYGVQAGNTGSAQYARFSHALGAVLNGFCGIAFQEFETTYNGKPAITKPFFVIAALEVSKQTGVDYLVIDERDKDLMIRFLQAYDTQDTAAIASVTNEAKSKMQKHINKHLENQTAKLIGYDGSSYSGNLPWKYLYKNYSSYKKIIKFMAFDIKAFTTSSGRNGHTVMGEMYVNAYCFSNCPTYLLLPRIKKKDLVRIKNSSAKEVKLALNHPNLHLLTYENLLIKDSIIDSTINRMEGKIFKGDNEKENEKTNPNLYFSKQKKELWKKDFILGLEEGSIEILY